ncbi:MAG: hypothetical protein AAFP78_10550 [Pseudomonadota bacterium]
MSAFENPTAETLFGALRAELGFDLSHRFLATVANELAKTGELKAAMTDALTLREIGVVEACSEFILGEVRTEAA